MRREAERNRKLYEYYLRESDKHGATYEDIAEKFGVSASRAWRIVQAEQKRLEKMHKLNKLLRSSEENESTIKI